MEAAEQLPCSPDIERPRTAQRSAAQHSTAQWTTARCDDVSLTREQDLGSQHHPLLHRLGQAEVGAACVQADSGAGAGVGGVDCGKSVPLNAPINLASCHQHTRHNQ